MKQEVFSDALSKVNVPILILDQKWHRLFALDGKPEVVKDLEQELNAHLSRQGKLNQELKELKKLKSSLMQDIVEHMDEAQGRREDGSSKHMEENKRLLEEVKQKTAKNEDELLELPKQIRDVNQQLMLETMSFCYERIRNNYQEAEEISTWIKQIRVELKKNIIRKQNREINNKEIYAYMHDIFGRDIVELFDVKNSDVDLITGEDRITGNTSDVKTIAKDSENNE